MTSSGYRRTTRVKVASGDAQPADKVAHALYLRGMRIVVGLSGGVDSSVAAGLLLEQGHEVIGMYMRNWHDAEVTKDGACPWIDDAQDAMLVADHLGIPFQVVDLSAQYRERIVDYMFREYAAGRTPNPDVLCNREIKFDVFLEAARALGAEAVATGHYCQVEREGPEGPFHLRAGRDAAKDQSYFLCQVGQTALAHALFPIGHLRKPEVREWARAHGLPTAEKKDSQGLCFVGKVHLPDFLRMQLASRPGHIVEIPRDHPKLAAHARTTGRDAATPIAWDPDDGRVVGEHPGAHFFTVGQRKGIAVGGRPQPLFVIERDVETNTLFVGMGDDHPGLYRRALFVHAAEVHEVRPGITPAVGTSSPDFGVRYRYRAPLEPAECTRLEEGMLVEFRRPQRGIASGQFAAWYAEDEVIGSGPIAW